jgi:hypothetical protein
MRNERCRHFYHWTRTQNAQQLISYKQKLTELASIVSAL